MSKCGRNLIRKCGPQNLMVTMVRPFVVTVIVFLNGHYYPINGNSLTGQDKQGVRHKTKSKETYI